MAQMASTQPSVFTMENGIFDVGKWHKLMAQSARALTLQAFKRLYCMEFLGFFEVLVPCEGLILNQIFDDLADWSKIIEATSKATSTFNLESRHVPKKKPKRFRPSMKRPKPEPNI